MTDKAVGLVFDERATMQGACLTHWELLWNSVLCPSCREGGHKHVESGLLSIFCAEKFFITELASMFNCNHAITAYI